MIEIDILHLSGNPALDMDASIDAILAAMLWPHKKATRDRFMLSRYLLRREGTAAEEMDAQVLKAFPRGLVSGGILFNCICKLEFAEKFKMSDFKSLFAELENFRFALKTIDNDIWPKYRCVSPLWGAYLWLCSCGFVDPSVVPCTRDSVGELVAAADALKLMGKRSRTPRSRERVLLRSCDDYHLSDAIMQLVSARPTPACDLAVKLNRFPD